MELTSYLWKDKQNWENLQSDSTEKEKTQINKFRTERKVTTDITKIQMIKRGYTYIPQKLDSLEE